MIIKKKVFFIKNNFVIYLLDVDLPLIIYKLIYIKMFHRLTILVLFFYPTLIFAQIGFGTTSPHPSAILDVSSHSKGFLLPRLNLIQRNSIENPAIGLMIFCLDCCSGNENSGVLSMFEGNHSWKNLPECPPDGGIVVQDDWDHDGIPNIDDIDDDNDGIIDTLETWTVTRLTQELGFGMSSYSLISGVDNEKGAVYKYYNIKPGYDLQVTIVDIRGPVSIIYFDESTIGEDENFNPVIQYHGQGNDEGQVDFKFEFLESGTNQAKVLSHFLFSPRDVDGSGPSSQMGEFQIVKNPNEVIVDDNTSLTLIQQGRDYRIEGNPSITNPGLGPQKEFLTSAFFTERSVIEVTLGIQKRTPGAYVHNRLFSITARPNILKEYDPPVLTSGYQNLTKDSDNDGFPDQFDLDSDNDGCSDAYEANYTRSTHGNFQFPINEVGHNGLYDALETFPDSGVLKRVPDVDKPYDSSVHLCY